MKTNAICPISNKKTDENVARFNALYTTVLLLLFLTSDNIIPIVFLLFDFSLRGLELAKYSPLAFLSRQSSSALNLKSKIINAGPKLFAARIGIMFSLVTLIFYASGLNTAAIVTASVFGICAFLETSIGFCVACQIYPLIYKLTYNENI